MNRHSIFGLVAAAAPADSGEVVVVKEERGQPHRGKVFAAVHAHLDDVPYYASGLCAKLMSEGYTGYVVRTSNDEKYGGRSAAQNILSNEEDHFRMAAALGFKDVFDFYYQNHDMDGISYIDLRGRLILIFRMLKVDTILSLSHSPARVTSSMSSGSSISRCGPGGPRILV